MSIRGGGAMGVIALVYIASIWSPGASAQDAPGAEFAGNKACKICHNKSAEGAQWNKWASLKHANAYKVLQGDEAIAVATEAGLDKAPAESPQCLKCHVTAYDVETQKAPAKIALEDGVQCESCHGPASLHLADAKKLMMKKDLAIDVTVHITKGDATVCAKCHNAESPTWDPEKYTLKDGSKAGFDFEQAQKKIAHPNPKKEAAAAGG